MQPTMIAGIVVALIIGVAVGYSMASPGEPQVTTTTIYSTVTSTSTVTQTQVVVDTQTAFKTITNTVTVPITTTQTLTQTETVTLNPMPPLEDLQQGVILRLKVGSAAGLGLAQIGFKNIAVIAQSNLYCIELGAVLSAVFNKAGQGTSMLYVVEPGTNEASVATDVTNKGFEAVVLAYGGNSPGEEIVAGFKSFVSALMDAGYNGAIVVHAAAFAAKAVDETLADENLCKYLQGADVYLYLPKPDKGVLEFYDLEITEDCQAKLNKIAEVKLG